MAQVCKAECTKQTRCKLHVTDTNVCEVLRRGSRISPLTPKANPNLNGCVGLDLLCRSWFVCTAFDLICTAKDARLCEDALQQLCDAMTSEALVFVLLTDLRSRGTLSLALAR